ncbi:cyclic peptide export ABC transporter [Myxococcus sp. CA051A]|uniref:Cyclic peptide export ABC transporter n=1 Tax=Myxococcus llanfairpwllgwyngyllgogerychwyrndrobwllllantysiliogogogochensis TaxID=2590453 RepID=A0A540WYS5_9BACT|nr:cyclic peptide export ABC transporter [Myxococcus llanfairpwllgwyngyllgogerychwyrndrobwllllantysiliogogogochensis]NTX08404.1 cyclic peptide export ABC transporter [Myxococcus sp. CA040A]NTX14639.1 cyclic peptide export ABC transporter [Myxococcus sp. CA056]NTX40458.1 cyclic peptide export ABC transporter [Myxococcus sp. CA033]NTX52314.1 cyclic peptide export ABC transporter [Myxococcus sp. CA039A]NTX67457.1 cyclic peptide export ABC transporter [Myxococcus sp. CA051A]
MSLLALLFQKSKLPIILAALLGILTGACSAALVAVMNQALTSRTVADALTLMPAFLGFAVAVLVLRIVSQMQLSSMQQVALLDLRLSLCRRMLEAPLSKLESAGPHKLLAALTEDIAVINSTISVIPGVIICLATLAGCLVYLAWLSGPLLMMILAVIAVVMASVAIPNRYAYSQFYKRRESQDALYSNFRTLIDGAKELQLHHARSEDFFNKELKPTAEEVSRVSLTTNNLFIITGSWGGFMVMAVIAVILFGVPRFQTVEMSTLAAYALVVLYLQQPLDGLMNQWPALSRSHVAMKKLEKLGLSLADPEPPADGAVPTKFERVELVDITHTYYREQDGATFTLGPINTMMRRGELVFLVGGNGSGKTTLAKLLTGLYSPEKGELRVDGVPITAANRRSYRQLFSSVFFDFHLFERMLGLDQPGLEEKAKGFLSRLQLQHKVRVEDGKLSTVSLSQGQRKRLALLTSFLEDRPIYVFDEWAADQDPLFRELFYREMLPALKNQGKLVFVISHDDRYFHLADRLLKLESGQLVSMPDTAPTAVSA